MITSKIVDSFELFTGLHSLPTHVCKYALFCTRFIHDVKSVSLLAHFTALIMCSSLASCGGTGISIFDGTVALGCRFFKSTVNNLTNGLGEPACVEQNTKTYGLIVNLKSG